MGIVLGCDYSSKEISIAFSDFHSICSVPVNDVAQVVNDLHGIFRSELTETPIYIESAWGRVNFVTTLALKRVATIVEVAACDVGLRVCWAHPSSWRAAIYGKANKRADAKERKEQAIAYVREHWPWVQVKDHNQAEALLIALYGKEQEDAKTNS